MAEKDYFRDDLLTIMSEIETARSELYAGHPIAKLIRGRWADSLKLSAPSGQYLTQGSAGSGNWAEVVWAAIYNRLVTESATSGYYACIGISPDGKKAVLSLMLGTTEVLAEYSSSEYEGVLRANAEYDLSLLQNQDLSGLKPGPIEYDATGKLARGYAAGTIVGLEYLRDELPEVEEIRHDISRMLALYEALHTAKADTDGGEDLPDYAVGAGVPKTKKEKAKARREKRRWRFHLQAERNRSLSEDAKKERGEKCEVEACGKIPGARYGEIAKNLLEAHHIVPFSDLEENVELDPKEDFRVVCPDCHRAIHKRRDNPYTLEEVSAAILGEAGKEEDA